MTKSPQERAVARLAKAITEAEDARLALLNCGEPELASRVDVVVKTLRATREAIG